MNIVITICIYIYTRDILRPIYNPYDENVLYHEEIGRGGQAIVEKVMFRGRNKEVDWKENNFY